MLWLLVIDMFRYLGQFLDSKDVVALSETCKQIYAKCHDDLFMKIILGNYGPDHVFTDTMWEDIVFLQISFAERYFSYRPNYNCCAEKAFIEKIVHCEGTNLVTKPWAAKIILGQRHVYISTVASKEYILANCSLTDAKYVSKNTTLGWEFFKKHPQFISWRELLTNPGIPTDVFVEHFNSISHYTRDALWSKVTTSKLNTRVSIKMIIKHPEVVIAQIVSAKSIPVEYWLQQYDTLRLDFKFVLMRTRNVPLKFLNENDVWEDERLVKKLVTNVYLETEVYRKLVTMGHIAALCRNPGVPSVIFEENIDNVHWGNITNNKGTEIQFLVKYFDRLIIAPDKPINTHMGFSSFKFNSGICSLSNHPKMTGPLLLRIFRRAHRKLSNTIMVCAFRSPYLFY